MNGKMDVGSPKLLFEKVSAGYHEYLWPFKRRLIEEVSKITQKEVRWHVAQMLSYLEVDPSERKEIIRILLSYVEEAESKIVKVNSLQALDDLAGSYDELKKRVSYTINTQMDGGSPSIVSRGRRML